MFNKITRALQSSFLLALLGFLCLSNVVVQGQGTTATGTAQTTSNSVAGTATNPATGTATGTAATGTATGTGVVNATGTAPATPTRTPTSQDPVAYLTMLNPKANSVNPPLFQIGTDIQFSWSIDNNLITPPVNLTIEAYMTNSPTSIITIGAGLPGSTRNYTWPGASQGNITNPIQTAIYTLRIFDGAIGRTGAPPASGVGGYLSTYSGLKFGLYVSSSYIPGSQSN
ncbi:hypothetical protein BGZ46_009908, partial [Entomortierella lignicola]